MNAPEVVKIYRIEVPGIETVIDKIQQLNRELEIQKGIKREADRAFSASKRDYDNAIAMQNELRKAIGQQTGAIEFSARAWTEFVKGRIGPLTRELGSRAAAMTQLSREWAGFKTTLQQSEATLKSSADAMDRNTRRSAEAVVSIKTINAERRIANKEADQLIKAQEQEAIATKKTSDGTKFAAGSYKDLYLQYKILVEAYRTTPPTDPLFSSIKTQAIEAKRKVDDFNRSLTPGNTLVGEYTAGIVQAFKRMGLDDLVRDQVNKSGVRLNELNNNFRTLRTILREVKQDGSISLEILLQKLTALDHTGDGAEQNLKSIRDILHQVGQEGKVSLDAIERALVENRKEAQALQGQVQRLENELKGVGGIGAQITKSIGDGFSGARKQLGQFIIGYLSFQAALSTGSALVRTNSEITDKIADMKRIIQATTLETDKLVASLRGIETRTSLNKLLDFSIIASKAGVAQENIAGVTKAIDQLQLVAGKELGDVEQTVTSVVKLVNVFEGPGKVTEENVLKFGNALVELANKGVATGGFLVDFAQRLAGIQGITKVDIQSVLGLGAAFEEQGQSAEVASTAITQVMIKMGQDIEKFAGIAKKPLDEFRKTLREAPAEAVLQVAEGLKGDAKAFDEIAPKFADLEAKGVRVQATFGVMADKADFFREKIAIASKALQDTNAIVEGAAAKQRTFGAVIDQIRKKFELLGTDAQFQKFLLAVASAVAFLAGHLSITIPLITIMIGLSNTWAGTLLRLVTALTLEAGALVIEKAQLVASIAARAAANTVLAIYTAATIRANIATGASAVAFRLLAASIAFITSPLGIVVGLVVALTTVFGVLSANAGTAASQTKLLTRAQEEQAASARVMNELQSDVAKQTAATKDEIQELVKVLKSSVATDKEKEAAYKRLIALAPDYLSGLTKENIATEEGIGIINRYIASLDQLSDAKARFNLKTRLKEQKLESDNLLASLKEERKTVPQVTGVQRFFLGADGKLFGFGDRNSFDVDQDIAKQEKSGADLTRRLAVLDKSNTEVLNKLRASIVNKQNQLKGMAKDSKEAVKLQQDIANDENSILALQGIQQSNINAATKPTVNTTTQDSTNIEELKKHLSSVNQQIKQLDLIKDKTSEQKKKLETLRKEKQEVQRQIRELGGKATSGGGGGFSGSRLTGETKDELKLIDTDTNEQLARLETAMLKQEEFARKDHTRILINDEATYLKESLQINQDAIRRKLQTIRGSNAEELRQRSELQRDFVKMEIETNTKLFQIDKQRVEAIKQRAINDAQEEFNAINDNPDTSQFQKSNAQVVLNEKLVKIQRVFNVQMDELEKQYGQQSEKNAEERSKALIDLESKTAQSISQNVRTAFESRLAQVDFTEDFRKQLIEMQRLDAEMKIMSDKRLSNSQKERELQKLDTAATVAEIDNEIDAVKKKIFIYNLTQGALAALNKEYRELLLHLKELEKQKADTTAPKDNTLQMPSIDVTSRILAEQLSEAFKLNDGEEKLLGNVIAEGFNTALDAMHTYFQAEEQAVRNSLKVQEDRLDLEKKQRLDRAQSAAEQQAIEEQIDEKKKVLEKQAQERIKKIKKSELKITLATELANIAAAAAANPLNSVTFGAAGIAMYALLAGLAFARYAINVKNIEAAQFARGGSLEDVVKRGGRFGGHSHAQGGNKFRHKGELVETEAEEAFVINKKSMRSRRVLTVTGTVEQIASAINEHGGGVAFAPGATVKQAPRQFALGGTLHAPRGAMPRIERAPGIGDGQMIVTGTTRQLFAYLGHYFGHLSYAVPELLDMIQNEKLRVRNSELTQERKREELRQWDSHAALGRIVRDIVEMKARERRGDVVVDARTMEHKQQQFHTLLTTSIDTLLQHFRTLPTDTPLNRAIGETFQLATMHAELRKHETTVLQEFTERLEQLHAHSLRNLELVQSFSDKHTREQIARARVREITNETADRVRAVRLVEVKLDFASRLASRDTRATERSLQRSVREVESHKFERGGSLARVLWGGGIFAGRTHAEGGNRFLWKRRPIETEVEEAFVINRKSMASGRVLTVTGTVRQIASAINEHGGGVRFAPGAQVVQHTQPVRNSRTAILTGTVTREGTKYRTMEFGGTLGSTLSAPTSPQTFLSQSGGGDMADLKNMVEQTQATILQVSEQTNRRIDRLEVVQVTKTVTDAQKKQVKNDAHTTL